MAYVTKAFTVTNPDIYINDCCLGGDLVRDHFLPLISNRFSQIQTGQEDWGWFLWFRDGKVKLAIDISCNDSQSGEFQIHVSSTTTSFGIFKSSADTPQLEALADLVKSDLLQWA